MPFKRRSRRSSPVGGIFGTTELSLAVLPEAQLSRFDVVHKSIAITLEFVHACPHDVTDADDADDRVAVDDRDMPDAMIRHGHHQ
jgi:hypothetical protein